MALVVGNSAYVNTGALRNSVNDARDIADKLKTLGFQVELGLDLNYEEFSNLVSDFRSQVKAAQASQVVFYYAGHGFQLHGLNHLVPIDAKLKSSAYLSYETLQLNQIMKAIRTSENQTLVVLLDACRNNPLPVNVRDSNSPDGLAQLQDVDRAYVVFSTRPGKVSLDGIGRNSPFAAALLKYMGAPALSIPQLMMEVREDVRAATQGVQITWDLSTISEDFYFNPATYVIDDEETITFANPEPKPPLSDKGRQKNTTEVRAQPPEKAVAPDDSSVEPPANVGGPGNVAVTEPSPSDEVTPVAITDPAASQALTPVAEGVTAAAVIEGEPVEVLVRGGETGQGKSTEDRIGTPGPAGFGAGRNQKDESDIDRPIRRKKLVKQPAPKVTAKARPQIVSRPPSEQAKKSPPRATTPKVAAPKVTAPARTRKRICDQGENC